MLPPRKRRRVDDHPLSCDYPISSSTRCPDFLDGDQDQHRRQHCLHGSTDTAECDSCSSRPAEVSRSRDIVPPTNNGDEREVQQQDHGDESTQLQCFGMFPVRDISNRGPDEKTRDVNQIEATVSHDRIIQKACEESEPPYELGRILCSRTCTIIDRLQAEKKLKLEMYWRQQQDISCQTRRRTSKQSSAELLVNVYGHPDVFEDVGSFFNQARVHLHDPIYCGHNVPYTNPHMLVEDGASHVVMTGSFQPIVDRDVFVAPGDVFDQFLCTEVLPEAATPKVIRTELRKHQKQALSFMLRKERGYRLDGFSGQCLTSHQWTDKNMAATSNPHCIYGGLVADQMGLGKTLQMISLIASGVGGEAWKSTSSGLNSLPRRQSLLAATLVVVPLSLLQTWNEQLRTHLVPQSLSWAVFHGPKRALDNAISPQCHLLLTTYDTVVAEYRKWSELSSNQSIFAHTWPRIVLDEAHLIRNPASLRTKAICALESRSRWAITGTPIQNRLTDLHPILQFLRASPFDDPQVFESMIIKPWKTQSEQSAVSRLKEVIKSIALRRTKATIDLPPREDHIRRIPFALIEKAQYEKLRLQDLAEDSLAPTIDSGEENGNVLQWIDSLRSFCSRGAEIVDCSPSPSIPPCFITEHSLEREQIGEFLNDATMPDLEDTSGISMNITGKTHHQSQLTIDSDGSVSAQRPCPESLPEFHSSNQSSALSISLDTPYVDYPDQPIFTKVALLLTDLASHKGKSVVFSFWRTTLSVLRQAMNRAGIQFLSMDGSMSIEERNSTIQSFRDIPEVKVLLSTIAVGGVGLDLTVANQVCLMEPQWNPTVEEQALSRVHRMNQTKPVTTIRYVMKDSIEESIIELQRRKTSLASLILSGDHGRARLSVLQDLKLLLK